MDCIFCKIIDKNMPSDIVYEDDRVMGFKDINPKAPFFILVLPKKHIESVNHLEKKDIDLMGYLFLTAKKIAEQKHLEGYKLVINVGRKGGQLIDHMHLHFLAGKDIKMP